MLLMIKKQKTPLCAESFFDFLKDPTPLFLAGFPFESLQALIYE